jgi:hypothetical protein
MSWKAVSALTASAFALFLGACSSAPGSHKTICTDHETLCVVAGIAVLGGAVAILQESGDKK